MAEINVNEAAMITKWISDNSKSNVNYQDLLSAIIKLLHSIAENTGSKDSAIDKCLPAGSNITKEDLQSIAKLSTAASACHS